MSATIGKIRWMQMSRSFANAPYCSCYPHEPARGDLLACLNSVTVFRSISNVRDESARRRVCSTPPRLATVTEGAVPMAEDTLASVIALHQPKRARSERPRTSAPRKRKPKVAKSESSESLIPAEFLPGDSAVAGTAPALPESVPAPPPAAPAPSASGVAPAGRWSVASFVLAAAAFTLAAVGLATDGWFARSLGSSDFAGWMFMAIGVSADLAALVTPICAARLWH